MRKLKKVVKSQKRKADFVSKNRVILAALAGAITGLAVTYLLESERGRTMLSQAGNSVKSVASNSKLPALLHV